MIECTQKNPNENETPLKRFCKRGSKHLNEIDEIKVGDLLRLHNGQCAKVIDIGNNEIGNVLRKHNNIDIDKTNKKLISIVIEDGTIITGLNSKQIANGLYNINKNSLIMNMNKNNGDIKNEAKKFYNRKIGAMHNKGVSSDIELAYNEILSKIGFKAVKRGFLEKFLTRKENRYPDGVLIRDGKMVFFEYDGESGHKDIKGRNNIDKDNKKNELYKEIVNKAQNKELKNITEVLVLRIRAKDVPMLNPQNNIIEINEYITNDKTENIKNALFQMAKILDENFNWGIQDQINNLLNQQEIVIPDFSLEVSRCIGFGTQNDRCGMFIATPRVNNFNMSIADECLNSDFITVYTENSGTVTHTSYSQFKKGEIQPSSFVKLYDYDSGFVCTEKELEDLNIKFNFVSNKNVNINGEYYSLCNQKESQKYNFPLPLMTYEEIQMARIKFPIQNGAPVYNPDWEKDKKLQTLQDVDLCKYLTDIELQHKATPSTYAHDR